jgi:hypothetical protein
MNRISIDLETLGTNVHSQIVSIGICVFKLNGDIVKGEHFRVSMPEALEHLNVTFGTLMFWLKQAETNPLAISAAFLSETVSLKVALRRVQEIFNTYPGAEVWANGTKFDVGMLEYQFLKHQLAVPWKYNADRCMRTLRALTPNVQVDYKGVAHDALDDAIWQAKFIAGSLTQLGVTE